MSSSAPKVLKPALVTIISWGMKECWGIVLMWKCLQEHASSGNGSDILDSWLRKIFSKRVHPIFNLFRWVTFFFLVQTRNNVWLPVLVRQSLQTCSTIRQNCLVFATVHLRIRAFNFTCSHIHSSTSLNWQNLLARNIQVFHYQSKHHFLVVI